MAVNAQELDFRLDPQSPCINAGTDIGRPFKSEAPNVGLYDSRS